MTIVEKERLAKLEEKTDNIVEKIDSVLAKLDNLDNKYITRNEFAIFKWTASSIIALGTAIATFLLIKR